MRAQDDAGGEKRKTDQRQEEQDVPRINYALLKVFEVGHNAERGNEIGGARREKLLAAHDAA